MTTNYVYGKDVLEFDLYKFDQNKLDARIKDAEDSYMHAVTTFVDDGLAANVDYRESPPHIALTKLLDLHRSGYTIRLDRFVGADKGMVSLTLRKPQHLIDEDLVKVRHAAAEQYEKERYALNAAETARQVQLSLDRAARDAEKSRIASEQKAAAEARERALAELRAEYHPT